MKSIKICELDCFFISFDEPEKEKHWAQLQREVPWSKRVDGVVGFDSAHKQCAYDSETDYLITIDGDNTIFPEFFQKELHIPPHFEDCVLSWNSINVINGLRYGNGGIKLWPKQFLLNMRSHENAETDDQSVDFCWDPKYIQLLNVYSTTHPNGSKKQAFRAGFREGVKMTLNRGQTVDASELLTKIHPLNLKRLLMWGSIGSDVINGMWAQIGTRVGVHYANVEKQNIKIVADYAQLSEFIEQFTDMSDTELSSVVKTITAEVREHTGINFVNFSSEQSAFIKQNAMSHTNSKNILLTEREVF